MSNRHSHLNVVRTAAGSEHVLASTEEAITRIARGEMVVVVDDEDRENEGDLVVAAAHATPAVINFMITHGRGLVCLSLTGRRAAELNLPPMLARNEDHMGTAFTVSIDGTPEHGVTTGISTFDRAKTIELALTGKATDLSRPGHIFPLIARDGGVLVRPGHTEASVDFAELAGLEPAGVIVEIIGADGNMLRLPDLIKFAHRHQLAITSIKQLQDYRGTVDGNRVMIRSAELVRRLTGRLGSSHVHRHLHSIDGLENIPPTGPFVLVANHSSYYDHFVIGAIMLAVRDTPTWFLTKEQSFQNLLSRIWHEAWYSIPVNRERAGSGTLRQVRSALSQGHVVTVYPEGNPRRRSWTVAVQGRCIPVCDRLRGARHTDGHSRCRSGSPAGCASDISRQRWTSVSVRRCRPARSVRGRPGLLP